MKTPHQPAVVTLPRAVASKPRRATGRVDCIAARISFVADRLIVGLTILAAATLSFGSHGAHPPNPRELGPVMIEAPLR